MSFMKIFRKILPVKVSAVIYRVLAVIYIYRLKCDHDKNRKTILMLNHFYSQDIKAITLANEKYNILVVDTSVLFKGAKIFFSEKVIDLLAPYDQEDGESLAQYRKECAIIFNRLKKKFGVDIIVTAADNYYWVREFIKEAKSRKVRTVVLDKEGLISPHSFESEAERTRKYAPFMSDYIYVWSERQREYWEKIGVKKELITVIGQPRSDLFYKKNQFKVDEYFEKSKPIITFFTYEDDAYIPRELVQNEQLSWRKMKKQTQEFLYQMATENEKFNFVFKAHPQQLDLEELRKKYNRQNLKVIGGSEVSNELIIRSELIIAFQTTAVLEAMFMGRKVVYTGWDEVEERLKHEILPFKEAQGLLVANSYEDFKIICKEFFAGKCEKFIFTAEQIEAKNKFVSNYFYKPDGHVSKRFFTCISEHM